MDHRRTIRVKRSDTVRELVQSRRHEAMRLLLARRSRRTGLGLTVGSVSSGTPTRVERIDARVPSRESSST